MAATHSADIIISSTIDTASASGVAFGTPLYVVPESTNSLDGDRVMVFTSASSVNDAEAAGFISEGTKDALLYAFAQNSLVTMIKVAYQDDGASETAAAALTAILAADALLSPAGFYTITLQSKTDADITAWATAVELLDSSTPRLLITQVYDANFTASTPAPASWTPYATISGYKRTAILAYGSDGVEVALSWVCNRSRFNLDLQSPGWQASVSLVAAETTIIKDAQVIALKAADINVGAVLNSTAPYFVKYGVMIDGFAIKNRITIDWFEERVRRKTSDLIKSLTDRGEIWTLDNTGVFMAKGIILEAFDAGASTRPPHFQAGQIEFVEDLCTYDTGTGRITVTANIQYTSEAKSFVYMVNFSKDLVVVEE